MDTKIELTPKEILDEKFTKDVKGYSSDEVDAFLDRIIKDYVAFDNALKQDAAAIEGLQSEIQALQNAGAQSGQSQAAFADRFHKLELENASLHNRIDGIKPGDNPTVENMQYIQRINQLEDFLYSIGYDPNSLKKRSQ